MTKDKLVAVSSIADVYSFDLNTHSLSKDRLYPDSLNVRALALVADTVFTLSIGSPAYLYKNSELVYHENDSAVFYDSMDFWNSKEGIALGDPIGACLSILITRDGGNTWRKTPCASLPKTINGEAAFAASDTNISIVGNKAWIASGGVASRVFFQMINDIRGRFLIPQLFKVCLLVACTVLIFIIKLRVLLLEEIIPNLN